MTQVKTDKPGALVAAIGGAAFTKVILEFGTLIMAKPRLPNMTSSETTAGIAKILWTANTGASALHKMLVFVREQGGYDTFDEREKAVSVATSLLASVAVEAYSLPNSPFEHYNRSDTAGDRARVNLLRSLTEPPAKTKAA